MRARGCVGAHTVRGTGAGKPSEALDQVVMRGGIAVDVLAVLHLDLDFAARLGHFENEAAALVLFGLALGAVHWKAAVVVTVPGLCALRHQALDRMRMPVLSSKMKSCKTL